MLIFNDEQRLRAGIPSLSKRCPYCRKALRAYPLILSDDAGFAIYHAACAAALAIEIQVDLYTFFNPPAPYRQLFVVNKVKSEQVLRRRVSNRHEPLQLHFLIQQESSQRKQKASPRYVCYWIPR
jgi:hypothetical protein